MSFIKKALKTIKNEYASVVEDGLTTDNTGFIDSGSYVVNALLSGSIYGGFASNRCTAIAGESSCLDGDERLVVYPDEHGVEYASLIRIRDLYETHSVRGDLYIETPTGELTKIHQFVKKDPVEIIHVVFEDGSTLDCSIFHKFSYNGNVVYAKDAEFVDFIGGRQLAVVSKTPIKTDVVYDLSIDSPHWYVTPNGAINHNTGKSFLALTTVKTFLDNNPLGEVIYFDSEAAFTQEMFDDRDIDTSRVAMIPVSSIDEFKTQAFQILGEYETIPKDERPPLLLILDSLGNLASNKELADTADGKQSQDMTRGRLIRSAFRVLTLKLGKLNVPLIVTNHTYTTMEMYSTQAMGGVGLRYAASTIIFLSKRKERDGEKNVIGNIVHVKTDKSRLTREQLQVDTLIYFDTGMDRYYGLADLAVEFGIFKKVSTRLELPDGSKQFISQINKNPEKYFTKELLDEIDSHCRAKFCYGKREDDEVLEELQEE